MDRRKIITGAAILASVGAVLSAGGCGAKSTARPSRAPTASPPAAKKAEPRVVVVNRADAATGAELSAVSAGIEPVDEVKSAPIELVASVDTQKADETVDSSSAGDGGPDDDARVQTDQSTSPSQADAPLPTASRHEPATDDSPPGIENAARSEIRFAEPGDGEARNGPYGQRENVAGEHSASGLTPLVVRPREIPRRAAAQPGRSPDAGHLRVARRPAVPQPDAKRPVAKQPVAAEPATPGPADNRPHVDQQPVTGESARPGSVDREPGDQESASQPSVDRGLAAQRPVVGEPVDRGHLVRQRMVPRPFAREPVAAAPAPPTRLPRAVSTIRSPSMVAMLSRANERVRHGIQLADKGALYASRKEFTTAVKLISQANDLEQGTRRHSKAAIAGFVAFKEANDFINQSAGLGEVDVARLVTGHKTPVLKDASVADMPPTIAAEHYFGYAKDQLAEAVGGETVGSIALYGLGRIIIAGAGRNSQQLEYAGPAMALYQAALIAEPGNYRAAHELGVLLVGSGQLEMGRAMLMSSAQIAPPQPTIWQNLAAVHSRMGEQQLAEAAREKAAAMQQQAAAPATAPQVQWVDPATFASTLPATDPLARSVPGPKSESTPAKAESKSSKSSSPRKRLSAWDPLNLRR